MDDELIPVPPELCVGQAAGRPEWQKGLPLEELEILDRLADAAYMSKEALKTYIAYTALVRVRFGQL